MRKLASIQKISEIRPIADADAIECAQVGGWTVVVKRGEFKPGDLAVYLEIDSWVPIEIAPFLSKGVVAREFQGVKGERLRTVKLRGQLSQGLLLPLLPVCSNVTEPLIEGLDVSQALNIQKWEAEIPAQLAGQVQGLFPSMIPKTDQERIQNLSGSLDDWKNLTWEVTEKLDGSSMTVYRKDEHFGVCSRNLELKDTENNSLWDQARKYKLAEVLEKEGNFAIQGEIIGTGIQGNLYKLQGQDFYVFDIFDIDKQTYLDPVARKEFTDRNNLRHVPIIDTSAPTPTIAGALAAAEGSSVLCSNAEREGLVFKCGETLSFKAISNKFLLKSKN